MDIQNNISQWPVTTGIILRTYPLTESSLIVRWITPDFGRISTVAKGARRQKSNYFGKLDLFFLADMSFRQSRSSELHTLREVTVRDAHSFLRKDLVRLELAAKAAALIEKHTETGAPLPGYYALFRDYLASLKNAAESSVVAPAFKIKFLLESGLNPDLNTALLSPAAKQMLKHFMEFDWDTIARIKPTLGQFNEITAFLDHWLHENL